MKKEIIRYIKFLIGLLVCSIGIITILNSELGLSPWDVLNQGLNKVLGITLGEANLLVGIFVVLFTLFLKQPIGSGTIINLLIIGVFMDLLINLDIIPKGENIFERVIILFIGIIIFSYGGYLYIASGIGCGPRDGLMVILTKRTGIQLWKIKTIIEVTVLAIGYFLGGSVGLGTVASSLLVGPFIQLFFKLNKKDIKSISHRSVLEEIVLLKNYFNTVLKKS